MFRSDDDNKMKYKYSRDHQKKNDSADIRDGNNWYIYLTNNTPKIEDNNGKWIIPI